MSYRHVDPGHIRSSHRDSGRSDSHRQDSSSHRHRDRERVIFVEEPDDYPGYPQYPPPPRSDRERERERERYYRDEYRAPTPPPPQRHSDRVRHHAQPRRESHASGSRYEIVDWPEEDRAPRYVQVQPARSEAGARNIAELFALYMSRPVIVRANDERTKFDRLENYKLWKDTWNEGSYTLFESYPADTKESTFHEAKKTSDLTTLVQASDFFTNDLENRKKRDIAWRKLLAHNG